MFVVNGFGFFELIENYDIDYFGLIFLNKWSYEFYFVLEYLNLGEYGYDRLV